MKIKAEISVHVCYSAVIKAQLIWLYLGPYCTDCHSDPLCDLERGWRKGRRQVLRGWTHALSHTHKCTVCPSHYFLTLSISHVHISGGAQNTHCAVRGGTHAACSSITQLHRLTCILSLGHSCHVGTGLHFQVTAHTNVWTNIFLRITNDARHMQAT